MSDNERDENIVDITPDGEWRPEPWVNGRYLAVRYNKVAAGSVDAEGIDLFTIQRELLCTSKFSSQAIIFESEESAAAECQKLNEQEAAKASAEQKAPPQEPSNEEPDA